jgi:hypothetical protein
MEFGRCDRCARDLVRKGDRWKPVPRGYRVVWRPRTGDPVADGMAGLAVVGREVTVRGVVVGERNFGSQRFALVRLNAEDRRTYVDKSGKRGPAEAIASESGAARPRELVRERLRPAFETSGA